MQCCVRVQPPRPPSQEVKGTPPSMAVSDQGSATDESHTIIVLLRRFVDDLSRLQNGPPMSLHVVQNGRDESRHQNNLQCRKKQRLVMLHAIHVSLAASVIVNQWCVSSTYFEAHTLAVIVFRFRGPSQESADVFSHLRHCGRGP